MVKEIQLTQGKITLVDDEDYERAMQLKWCAEKAKGYSKWYAVHGIKNGKKSKLLRLHRFIMNAKPDEEIDHINGDGLDNRKCNLRIVTHQQNVINRKKTYSSTTSHFKGVTWHKRGGCWQSQIKHNDKYHYLGMFIDEIQAAEAYDEAAKKYHGEHARLNFPAENQ